MLFKKSLTLLLTLLMSITLLGVNTNITKAEGEKETSNEPLTQEVTNEEEPQITNTEEVFINTISIKEDLIDINEELNKEITLSFEIEDTEYQEYTYIWSFYDENDTLINEVKHEHTPNKLDTLTITIDEETLNYKYLQVKVIGETNNSEILSSKVSINITESINNEDTVKEEAINLENNNNILNSNATTQNQLYVGIVDVYDCLEYHKSLGYGYYGSIYTDTASFYIYEDDEYRKVNNVISSNENIVSYDNGNNTLTIKNKGYTTLSYKENDVTYVIDYNPVEVYMSNGKLKATFNNQDYLVYQNYIQLWFYEENGQSGSDTYIRENISSIYKWEKTKKSNEYIFSGIETLGFESGDYRIDLSYDDNWNRGCFKNIKITSSVKTKPILDKTPVQQADGSLRIYCKDKTYLTSVCEKYDQSGKTYGIRLVDTNDGNNTCYYIFNSNYESNNITGPFEEKIGNETYYYISISQSVLIDSDIVSSTYDIALFGKGYAIPRWAQNDFADITINTPLSSAPSDIQVEFDEEVGVIIRSSTKNYLKNIKEIDLYSESLVNRKTYYFNKSTSDFIYDEQNEYLYISNNKLNNKGLLSGNYENVIIYADGYGKNKLYYSDLNIQTSVKEAPNDISITFNSKVGVIINSDDKDYLQNVSSVDLKSSSLGINRPLDKSSYNGFQYDSTNQYLYVSIDALNNRRILSGTYNEISISSSGYTYKKISDQAVKITTSIKECPTDVKVTFDQTKGLIIKSSNTSYLQKVSYISIESINDSDCHGSFSKESSQIKYDSSKKYLFISMDSIIENGILTGDYDRIYIEADLYTQEMITNENIRIETPVIKAPTDLNISYDVTKGVIINSEIKEYLQSIKSINVYSETLKEGRNFFKEYNEIVYDTSNQYAYIPNSILENVGAPSGTYSSICINSANYTIKNINSLNLVIATSIVAPPSVEVGFATGVGLMIYSEDKTYLQNISYVDVYSNSLQSGSYFTSDDSDFEYKSDATFEGDKKGYLCISDAKLAEHLITTGIYDSIYIISTGYGRKNAIGLEIITNVPAAPSDISITFDSKVGLIINSNNKDYLKTMNWISISAANSGDVFYEVDSDLIYDDSKNYLYVPLSSIKNHKLVERTYFYFNLFSTKYSNKGINANINIASGIKVHPNDINISFDENVGIIFKSSNTDYLQKIECISLYNNENEYDYFTSKDFTYDKKNSRLVISTNRLNSGSITSSTIKEAYISTNNYTNYSNQNLNLSIETTVISSNNINVTYQYDSDVGLIIESDNKEYLKNASYIDFRIGNRTLEKVAKYDEANEYLYVKLTDLYECVNKQYGTYYISLVLIKENGYSNKVIENELQVSLDANTYNNYINTHKDYEIIYRLNGGTNDPANPKDYNLGDPNITLKSPTKKGYTFTGWFDSNDKKVTTIKKGTTGDIVLTAKYTENTYKLAYNANGGKGTLPKTLTYTYIQDNPITEAEPTRIGYTFLGWSTDKKAIEPEYEANDNIKGINADLKSGSTITLYAVWKANTYRVCFKSNDHDNLDNYYIDCSYDQTYKLNNDIFEEKGKFVSKWTYTYKDAKGNNVTKTINGDASIKNLCVDDEDTITLEVSKDSKTNLETWTYNKYTVKYVLNGGKNHKANKTSYTVQDKDQFTFENPTREDTINKVKTNITFQGWYDNPNFDGEPIESTNGLNKNLTLYAKWNKPVHTITYKDDDTYSNPLNPKKYIEGTTTITLQKPTKQGYTFVAWINTANGKKITSITNKDATNYTLKADWKENSYTITYNVNGGVKDKNATNKQSKVLYSNLTLLNGIGFSKDGYTLVGWSTNKNDTIPEFLLGENQPNLEKTSVTLYAVWSKSVYWYLTNNKTELHLTNSVPATSIQGEVKNTYLPNNLPKWHSYKDTITSVEIDNKIKPVSTAYWFYELDKVTSITNINNSILTNLDTSNVIDMSWMFENCSLLTSINLSSFDTSKVTKDGMKGMFYGCSSLENLDLSSFDTSNITDTTVMFYNSTNLEKIIVSYDFNVSNVDLSENMFYGCVNLEGGSGSSYNGSYVDKTRAHIDDGVSNPGYFTAVSKQIDSYNIYNQGSKNFGSIEKTKAYMNRQLKDFINITYKEENSDKSTGTILSIKVNGESNYSPGKYPINTPIVITIARNNNN